MQHFFEYINSNKFNQSDLEKSNVVVTLKIDGTSLQIGFDGDKISFHKRGKDDKTLGLQLTQIDAFTNYEYYNAMKSIRPSLEENKYNFSAIKILNTEILSDANEHIIKYNQKPKGGLVLLNGVSINDKSIDQKMIESYAKKIGIEFVPIIFMGSLSDKLAKLIDYVKNNCDPHNVKNTGTFKDDILNILNASCNSPLMDTQDGKVEGFVFNFNLPSGHILLKIDSPEFVTEFAENKETDEDRNVIENVLKKILNYFEKNNFDLGKYNNDEFKNLLLNFEKVQSQDSNCINFLYGCAEESQNVLTGMLNATSQDINLLPKKYAKYASDKKFFWAFRMFIWVLGKKKQGKNYPIMKEFNKFVSKIIGE